MEDLVELADDSLKKFLPKINYILLDLSDFSDEELMNLAFEKAML